MERVTVKRISVITPETGEREEIVGEWVGALRANAAELLVTFTEPVEGGKVFNRVLWRDGALTVDRKGAVLSTVTFRAGERSTTELSYPPITLPMTVETEEVLLLPTPVGVGFRVIFTSNVGEERRRTELTVTAIPA